jgi:hypothetical protein
MTFSRAAGRGFDKKDEGYDSTVSLKPSVVAVNNSLSRNMSPCVNDLSIQLDTPVSVLRPGPNLVENINEKNIYCLFQDFKCDYCSYYG